MSTAVAVPAKDGTALDHGTYEILRARLLAHGADLRERLEKLNAARREVFGSIKAELLATHRIATENNCLPRDLIPIGSNRFLLGYNVHLGLRSETQLSDVFSLYEYRDGEFHPLPLIGLEEQQFETDFKSLYRYYKNTVFAKFSLIEPHLFMEFRVGRTVDDFKTFKWLCNGADPKYLGNRFDHEYLFPPQHEFEWKRTHRELHRSGLHPHISIEDRVFLECVGGDLTIKIEDNTDTGEGIYAEPVDVKDQTLDDAEIYYASVGNLILLKVRPYQESAFRYLVFNEKVKEVRRIDAIADSCVLLPDAQGIIFSRGYYLQSGEFKVFESGLTDMRFYKRIAAANGEDFLFAFYNRESGEYVLLNYNRIARAVDTPIHCGGFSIFANGDMAIFRTHPEPQRHHVIQLWRTPFTSGPAQTQVSADSWFGKIGNPALVEAMAECQEVLALLGKEDSFAGLYLDLVKRTTSILDSHFWLNRAEASDLASPLQAIKDAAAAALAEFDKVTAIKRQTARETERVIGAASKLLESLPVQSFDAIAKFIEKLNELRAARGDLVSLKELRYVDLDRVEKTESAVLEANNTLSERTVDFLLGPDALTPIRERVDAMADAVAQSAKVSEARKLSESFDSAGKELDLLIETLGGLKIQDATETARVVDAIGAIYATLNQSRAALKQRIRELQGAEAVTEFGSQMRLLDQALTNYLDLSDTTTKCDEHLNRLLIQVEELEARFADFEEFVVTLAEKRTAISGAFEQRKLELVEQRNRKAAGLMTAAERILNGIKHRSERMTGLDELNSYFAADAMVEKVRDISRQLLEAGDTVKADDLTSRLKVLREDAARQLKDRRDLFAPNGNAIQLGRHQFLVSTQELELTVVQRGEQLTTHITGTKFFEPIVDEALATTKAVWAADSLSETSQIYRGEWLAYRIFRSADHEQGDPKPALERVRSYLAGRVGDGYVRGVHDLDAAQILEALTELHRELGLLRYSTASRTMAALGWAVAMRDADHQQLAERLRAFGETRRAFPNQPIPELCRGDLRRWVEPWTESIPGNLDEAIEYLFEVTSSGSDFAIGAAAAELAERFRQYLASNGLTDRFHSGCKALDGDPAAQFELCRNWVRGFVAAHNGAESGAVDEAAWALLHGPRSARSTPVSAVREVTGLKGSHSRIESGSLRLDYHEFMTRVRNHERDFVPLYERCQELKRQHLEAARRRLGLDHFKPKVLTSFVRNRLIDTAYLPLIGDNLAKQIGAAGDAKRTDRMGMLLLVSPPGYGKTTLVEYLASRLGLVFIKVNGPAIGERITSLDPGEAPNAAAREELEKLNLAFEMGDNVMICLDDIQHLNPEFLQKFIPLCDGSRRIEGVYRGTPRTYDLRGRKVAVVMAGNPYTESGEKFRIPDMLANRADTYNLGDVIGAHAEAFRTSYIENAAASNPTLAPVATRHHADVLALLRLAEDPQASGIELEGNWSPEEQQDFINVMKKLIRVRDVVLRVNEEYIRSAAQADAYRTEPPFKLQGSYRNMNRLAEKIAPVMTDAEVEELIATYYRNESQTLTSGAEANLLKFKELTNTATPAEVSRWEEIKKTFRKRQLLGGGDEQDPVARVVANLGALSGGLTDIHEALTNAVERQRPIVVLNVPPPAGSSSPALPQNLGNEVAISQDTLAQIWELIEADRVRTRTEPNGQH